jgi:hypothetical protein
MGGDIQCDAFLASTGLARRMVACRAHVIDDDRPDLLLRSISRLVVLTPDERRAERFRERSRLQMRRPPPKPGSVLGPVLFTGLCVIYLGALVLDLLRLREML